MLGAKTPEGKVIAILLTISLALMTWNATSISTAFADDGEGAQTDSGAPAEVVEADQGTQTEAPAAEEAVVEPAVEPAVDDPAPAEDTNVLVDDTTQPDGSPNINETPNSAPVAETSTNTATTLKGGTDTVSVVVEAPDGALPEGAKLVVANATVGEGSVKGIVDDKVVNILAADISFADKDDKAIKPAADVTVTMSGATVADGQKLHVVHVVNGAASLVKAETSGGAATFQASDFSPYALVVTAASEPVYTNAKKAPATREVESETIIVTFVAEVDDEEGQLTVEEREVAKNAAIGELPEAPTKAFSDFARWAVNGETVTAESSFSENTTVEAQYTEWPTVSFYNDGNELIGSAKAKAGEAIGDALPAGPASTLAGYEFEYWKNMDTNEVVTAETIVPVDGMNVIAVSETIEFVVSFYNEDGSELIDTQYYSRSGSAAIGTMPDAPTIHGKVFEAYKTDEGVAVTAETPVTSNMDLYASYRSLPEVVFYMDDGETVLTRYALEAGSQIGSLPQHPSKEGYIFDKWVLVDDPETEVTATTVVPETGLNVKAQFKAIETFKITANYYYTIKDEQGHSHRVDFAHEIFDIDGAALDKAGGYVITVPASTQVDEDYISTQPTYYPKQPTITVTRANFPDGATSCEVEMEYVDHTAVYDFAYLLKDLAGSGYTEIEGTRERDIEGVLGSYVTATVKDFPYAEVESVDTAQITQASGQVLNVKYTRKNFTLTYNTDGGTFVEPAYVPYGTTVTVAGNDASTRQGYTFVGWFTDEACTQAAPSTIELKQDTTLFAKWEGAQVNYTVVYMKEKYDNATGTFSWVYVNSRPNQHAVTGTTVTAAQAPNLSNMDGYEKVTSADQTLYPDSSIEVAPDGTSVLKVYYKLIRYRFVFNTDGGTINIGGQTYSGSNYVINDVVLERDLSTLWPATSSEIYRNNHSFEGWNDGYHRWSQITKLGKVDKEYFEGANSNHVVTWTAQWSRDPANNSNAEYWFQKTDGTWAIDPEYTQTGLNVGEGGLGPKEVAGYSWHNGDATAPEGYEGSSNKITAVEESFRGAYVRDDNHSVSGATYYEFEGHSYRTWRMQDGLATRYRVTFTYTFRFYYDRAQYQIDYYDGESLLTTKDGIFYEANINNDTYNYTPAKPAGKENYTWGGWYADKGFATKYTFDKMPGNNLVLYAKWIAPQYTVTFNSNGGSPTFESVTVDEGSTVSYPGSPSRENYLFDAWYTEDGELYVWDRPVTEDITLYAHWVQKTLTYTVHYNEYDENGVFVKSILPDKVVKNPALTIGQRIDEESISVAGYLADANEKSINLSFNDDENVIEFKYTKRAGATTYYVRYVDAETGEDLIQPTDPKPVDGSQVTVVEEAVNIPDYYPLDDVIIFTLTSDPSQNVVIFKYSAYETLKAQVVFVDMDGVEIPGTQTQPEYVQLNNTYQPTTTAPNGYVKYEVTDNFGAAQSMYRVTDELITNCGTSGLVITVKCQKQVTIQAKNKSKDYDGTALTSSGTGDVYDPVGLLEGHRLTGIEFEGSQTEVGSSPTVPKNATISGASEDYYHVTYKPATLTVRPIEVTITVEPDRWNDGNPYDGTGRTFGFANPNKTAANYVIINNTTYSEEYLDQLFNNVKTLSETKKDAGFYTIPASEIRAALNVPEDPNYKVTVYVRDGELTIPKAELTVTTGTDTKPYDGTPLVKEEASIEGLVQGETATIRATGSQIEVGSSSNGYAITWGTAKSTNYIVKTRNLGTLTVTAATVTVTVADRTLTYNGETQYGYPDEEHPISFSGLAEDHTATIGYTPSSGKDANTYNNGSFDESTFKVVDADNNDVTANYTLGTLTPGKLTIDPLELTIAITGANDTKTYDATEHSITGWTASCEGSTLFDAGKVSYSGQATAARTEAGKTDMGLDATKFSYSDANIEATFEIAADGYMQIDKAALTITANPQTYTYNGQPQGESEPVYNDPAVIAEKVKQKGLQGSDVITSIVLFGQQTNAGVYETEEEGAIMPSNATIGEATNNYNITYKPGTLTIKPCPVTVTITGNSETKTYTGEEQTLEGYTVSIDDPTGKYTEADFTFDGVAKVSGKDAGTYKMGLNADQFKNNNKNYDVTFDVTDGEFIIVPAEYELTFDPNGGTFANGSADALVIPVKVGSEADRNFTIINAPTRDGYEFDYWEGSKYYPGQTYEVKGDHTFTAQWKKKPAEPEKKEAKNALPKTGDDNGPLTGTLLGTTLMSFILLFVARRRMREERRVPVKK